MARAPALAMVVPMKVIQVSPMGNMGNRMIQYMVALALAERVPGAQLAQIHLPEWQIQIPPHADALPRTEIVTDARVDLARLAAALNDGSLDCVDIRTYGQQMVNFLPRTAYLEVFRAPELAIEPCGPDDLLCNIRQGDILDAHHSDYVLIPLDFYTELVEQTGLKPVFCGQLEPSPYIEALRGRFPGARFVPSQGAVGDFAYMRRACNIVPAISSFSWLAAWLSGAERIFMPVLGVFHPLQARSVDLLPLDDPRFSFYLFPFQYAVPVADFAAAHAALRGLWRKMPPARLARLLAAPAQSVPLEAHLAIFDEAFYLAKYPDIADAVAGGHFPSGRHHYENFGFAEGRDPCRIDKAWYCQTYPIAAVEMSQGDAIDPLRHWISLGAFRGYARCSDMVTE